MRVRWAGAIVALLISFSIANGKEAPLPEGHYVLLVPAMYPPQAGEPPYPNFCFVTKDRKSVYEVKLLGSRRIRLYLEWEGNRAFDLLPRGVPRAMFVSGSARLIDPGTLKGEMTVRKAGLGGIFVEVRRGEWSLRPATERAVKQRFVESLTRSADLADEISFNEKKKLTNLDSPEKKGVVRRASGFIELPEEKGLQWIRQDEVRLNPDARGIEFELTKGPPGDEVRGPKVAPEIQRQRKRAENLDLEALQEQARATEEKLADSGNGNRRFPAEEEEKSHSPKEAKPHPDGEPEAKGPQVSTRVDREPGIFFFSYKEWLTGLIVLLLAIAGGIWWWRLRS